jgi:hypothetical protein
VEKVKTSTSIKKQKDIYSQIKIKKPVLTNLKKRQYNNYYCKTEN